MPRIQINRIEASQLSTYGRCLYPGELMIVRGETRAKDLLLCGVLEFDELSNKPTENGAKTIVTSNSVVMADGTRAYTIDNVASIGSASSGSDAIKFTKLIDNTQITLFPVITQAGFSKRPIIAGPTSDSMSYQKTDEIALVSDLDGAWVSSVRQLSSFTTVGTVEIDLSDYLPNDNKSYLVWLIVSQYSGTTTQSAVAFSTSLYNPNKTVGLLSRSDTPWFAVSPVIPVGSDRKLILTRSMGESQNFNCSAMGYRKIGGV